MDHFPFPDMEEMQMHTHTTLDEAMDAYAVYARDKGYPYLAAWKPWLHFAGKLRRYYSLEDEGETEPSGEQSAYFHFSTTMSVLRNRSVPEVFGLQGLDFAGASLRVFSEELRRVHESGTLEDFQPPVLSVQVEQDGYELYDPAAVDLAAAEEEEYNEEAEGSSLLSESEAEPDEQPLDEADSQGDPVTLKEFIGSDDTPTITSARDEDSLLRQAAGAYSASEKLTAAHGEDDFASHHVADGPNTRR